MKFELRVTAPFNDRNTGEPLRPGATLITSDEARATDIAHRKLGQFIRIMPDKEKSGKKVIVYQNLLYKIGGIETADYELAKAYSDRNIVFVFKMADFDQAKRLGQFCEVVMDEGQNFECDVLILANYDSYAQCRGRIKARKVYQQVHADWGALTKVKPWTTFTWQPEEVVDRVITVSETAQKGLKTAFREPIDSIVVNNLPPTPNRDFRTFLTLSRLTPEKGGDLVMKMIRKFHEAGKHFLWIIAATRSSNDIEKKLKDDPSVVFLSPGVERPPLVGKVDYVVQLSYSESSCYTLHEALAYGTPFIGTRIPEFEKRIKPGKNGYLVDFSLKDLDVEKIFKSKLNPEPLVEKPDPLWEKVLNGSL